MELYGLKLSEVSEAELKLNLRKIDKLQLKRIEALKLKYQDFLLYQNISAQRIHSIPVQ